MSWKSLSKQSGLPEDQQNHRLNSMMCGCSHHCKGAQTLYSIWSYSSIGSHLHQWWVSTEGGICRENPPWLLGHTFIPWASWWELGIICLKPCKDVSLTCRRFCSVSHFQEHLCSSPPVHQSGPAGFWPSSAAPGPSGLRWLTVQSLDKNNMLTNVPPHQQNHKPIYILPKPSACMKTRLSFCPTDPPLVTNLQTLSRRLRSDTPHVCSLTHTPAEKTCWAIFQTRTTTNLPLWLLWDSYTTDGTQHLRKTSHQYATS